MHNGHIGLNNAWIPTCKNVSRVFQLSKIRHFGKSLRCIIFHFTNCFPILLPHVITGSGCQKSCCCGIEPKYSNARKYIIELNDRLNRGHNSLTKAVNIENKGRNRCFEYFIATIQHLEHVSVSHLFAI